MINKMGAVSAPLILWLIIIIALPGIGQTTSSGLIEGSVVDIETGHALSNVKIILKGTYLKGITDSQGRYFISNVPAGKFEIVATMAGYKKETKVIKVSSNRKVTVDFKLSASEVLLDKILVTATKTERSLDGTPIPADLVNREQIKKYNALNAGEAIEQLAGLHFYKSYGPMENEKLRVQGLPAGHTLTLLDGERIEGRFPLTQIPAELIERVEVVKGPSSVLYGSDAIGGVVNVITRSFPLKPTVSAGVSMGSHEAKIITLSHSASVSDFGYLFSFDRNRTEGEERERNWYKSENLFAKLGYQRDSRNNFILRGGYYHEDLSARDEEKFDFGLKGKVGVGNTSDIVVKGYGVQSRDKTHVGGSEDATISDADKYRGEVQWLRKFTDRHTFTLGTEILYEKLQQKLEEESPDIDKDQHLESIYIQDESSIGPFSLLGAARLDYHSIWGSHFSPKSALLYKATNWLDIRAGIGRAFKAPSFQRLYRKSFHGGGGGFWITGNTDLKPETSTGSNLELMFHPKDIFNARIGLFRHDLENMIHGYMVYPDPADKKNRYYTYRNIGKAMTQGVETEIKTKPFWGFATAVKYGCLDTKDKETGKELTYTPRHKVKAELSYFNRRFGSGITLIEEYVGTRFQDEENKEELPSYFLTNIKINQSIKDYVFIFLTIDNVFGEEYKDVRFSEDSRTYKMGLNLKF